MNNAEDDLVRKVLENYGRMTKVELAGYTRVRDPVRHLYGLVAEYPERGGRMLRPSICLATASAFGVEPRNALAPAVAIELLHNAFLVHDDIEDESEYRRGVKTLHESHGVPLALNAGDALCLLALQAITAERGIGKIPMTEQLQTDLLRAALESVEGQALELGWRADNVVHLADCDYLEMVLKKTCWYSMIYPLRAGAAVAQGAPLTDDAFVIFGFLLGAAFQIQDDLLNLIGDPVRYGKELNGDLREGKRTVMLIHLLRSVRGGEKADLVAMLSSHRVAMTGRDVLWIRERMDEHGSIQYARKVAHALAAAAMHEFENAFSGVGESEDLAFLRNLPRWVLTRA